MTLPTRVRPSRPRHGLRAVLAGVLCLGLVAGCTSGDGDSTRTTDPSSSTPTEGQGPSATGAPGEGASGAGNGSESTFRGSASRVAPYFMQDFGQKDVDSTPAVVKVEPAGDGSGPVMERDMVGLSFESEDITDHRWGPDQGNLDEMLLALGSPGLRFGGNSLDRRVFWTSSGENAPDGYDTVITPEDLRRIGAMARRVGSDVTLGIPLGMNDPERGADMVAHAVDAIGNRLVGVSIGNEPNGFTADEREGLQIRGDWWDTGAYQRQLRAYVDAIEKKVDGEVPIIGPGAYDGTWMSAFLDADLPGTTALTQHWYATYDCDSSEVPGRGPEPENLLSDLVHRSAANQLGIGKEKADAAGLPLWVEETGSTSCVGDTASSRTHATALWTVDYVLHATEMGVERMNMHSMLGPCEGGTAMSVVCSVGGRTEESGAWGGSGEVLPSVNYHGLHLASLSVGGRMSEVDVRDGGVAGGGTIRAYAVKKGNSYTVTLVNTGDLTETGGKRVRIEVPKGFTAVRAAQVAGPANDAVEKTTYQNLITVEAGRKGSGIVAVEDGKLVANLAAGTATAFVFTPTGDGKPKPKPVSTAG
ncbi:hypothetical protein [Brevibacterium litoralis]|uniref:hypothetical protein n=1 Tax=Brevibacterium litoralis TaxID=3138935 RepID=UPI0032EE3A70